MRGWRAEFARHLKEGILDFWLSHAVDRERGGFHGVVNREGRAEPGAYRSLVLEARAVWTFSAAYRCFPRDEYRDAAAHGLQYLNERFWDPAEGGWYWSVESSGRVKDGRKHLYAQGFALYGLSEYYRAFADEAALSRALDTFTLLDRMAHDEARGGYGESFTRDWKPETRHNPIGVAGLKSTNTHLHLLEPFSNTVRAAGPAGAKVRERLEELYGLFFRRIADPAGFGHEFFKPDWTPVGDGTSYGHDVEGAWLIREAAEILGRPEDPQCRTIAQALIERSLKFGYDHAVGGLWERGPREGPATKKTKTWWAQAEMLVALLELYGLTRDPKHLDTFEGLFRWILTVLYDAEYGEWFQTVREDGSVDRAWKITPWKCPYHNARACLECIRRLDLLAG